MLYVCIKFVQSISRGFRDTDPDSRVDAKVVANVDGQTRERTENQISTKKNFKFSFFFSQKLF